MDNSSITILQLVQAYFSGYYEDCDDQWYSDHTITNGDLPDPSAYSWIRMQVALKLTDSQVATIKSLIVYTTEDNT